MMRFVLAMALLCAAPAAADTTVSTLYAVSRPITTVGALPTCNAGAKGAAFMVTDALTPVALATVTAGGAVSVPVVCNGTNWIVG